MKFFIILKSIFITNSNIADSIDLRNFNFNYKQHNQLKQVVAKTITMDQL